MQYKIKTKPLVSILLPIRNESHYISRTLDSLIHQTINFHFFEVIIADGLSEDNSTEIIQSYQHKYQNFNLKLLKNPKKIFASGFNLAYEQASGEIIIMLGGHTYLAKNYIEKCIQYLNDHPEIDCIGGVIETTGETWMAKVIAGVMSSVFGVGNVDFRIGCQTLKKVDTVAFGAYRRSIFMKVGLLDEKMIKNQDDEFNYRILAHGGRIFLAPDIHIVYYSRINLTRLFAQYFRYGFWKVRVLQKWPKQMRGRHFIPAVFVFGMLFFIIESFFLDLFLLMFIIIAALYLITSIIASILIVIKNRDLRMVFMAPLIFFILHISYGSGFLIGSLRFFRFWKEIIK